MVYLFMSNIFLIFILKVMITYSGWGRNTSWSVDSNLPLYIIKDPQLFVKDIVVHIKCYSYIYIIMIDILYYLGIVVSIIFVPLFIGMIFSIVMVSKFPNSKVSLWLKKHIVTDEDLEPF